MKRTEGKAKTDEEARTEHIIAAKETAAGRRTADNGRERLLHKLFRIYELRMTLLFSPVIAVLSGFPVFLV